MMDACGRSQLFRIEGFRHVVVCSGAQAFYDILSSPFGREQYDVGRRKTLRLAYLLADLDAVHIRHHPVQDDQLRRVLALNRLPRVAAVGGGRNVIPPSQEGCFEK